STMRDVWAQVLRASGQDSVKPEVWLELMQRAVSTASNGIVITDPNQFDNPVIYVNPAFERITGYTAAEVLNRNCRFMQGESRGQIGSYHLKTAIQQGRECCVTLQNYRKDGTSFWNELCVTPIFDAEGHLTYFIGIQNDITQRKEAQAALRRQEHDLHTVVESMVDGLVIVNQRGEVIFVNRAAEKLFNRTADQLIGQSLGIPVTVDNLTEIDIHRLRQPPARVEIASNATLWQGSPAYLISLRDITERSQEKDKIAWMALYDPLTKLPNRVLFIERLQHVIDLSRRCSSVHFALLFIDLDRFKLINDSLGHGMGDQLLIGFTRRIEHQLRVSDTLARLSGDEFAILLEDMSDLEDVTQVVERIHAALSSPFELEGRTIFTGASIGIALGRPDLQKPEDLIREADTAMYRAKAQGGSCYAIFDQEMHNEAMSRLQLETDLRYAVKRQELEVHYQPLVDLRSNQLVGLEALLRWHHPQQGDVSPEQFIPIAEETGLIIPMGQYVLEQACQQIQNWLREGWISSAFTLSVNFSSKQLSNTNLVHRILQILAETGLNPSYLQLEITESMLMDNPTVAASVFQELESHSIRLALDDFGTGYSSLSHLQKFPVRTLKIDRSFVARLETQAEDREIIQSIVSLAHTLKMDVIAEGIETEAQLCHLKTSGCDIGQGFLFDKALTPQAVSDLLRRQSQQAS
ncbi:MAG: EAL domain-containing protein, partial [Cyanobacteria bacterium P01_G01_bin.38]